jgi:hypothetical protein
MEKNDYEALDAKIQRLKRQSELSEQREISYLTRRAVAEAVQGYSFRDGQSQRDFHEYVSSQIRPSEDALETYEGVPLNEFVKQQYQMRPRLHPKSADGSGTASTTMPVDPAKAIDRKQIRPGMTPGEIAEIGKALASALVRE